MEAASFLYSILKQHAWNLYNAILVEHHLTLEKSNLELTVFQGSIFSTKPVISTTGRRLFASNVSKRNGWTKQFLSCNGMGCGTWESGYETRNHIFFRGCWCCWFHRTLTKWTGGGQNIPFLLGETLAFKSHILEQITAETAGYCKIFYLLKNDCELLFIFISKVGSGLRLLLLLWL